MTRTSTKRRTRRPVSAEARAAARQRDAELAQRAAEALADPKIGDHALALLNCSGRILSYSLRNQTLLMDQAAERGLVLRDVDTFRGWQERGRCVRKGETGLRIVAPVGRKDDDQADTDDVQDAGEVNSDGEEDSGRPLFRTRVVFDISQTDGVDDVAGGEPAAAPDAAALLLESLTTQTEKAGYTVRVTDTAPTGSAPVTVDHDARQITRHADAGGRELVAAMAAAVAEILTRAKPAPKPRQAREAAEPLTLAVV